MKEQIHADVLHKEAIRNVEKKSLKKITVRTTHGQAGLHCM